MYFLFCIFDWKGMLRTFNSVLGNVFKWPAVRSSCSKFPPLPMLSGSRKGFEIHRNCRIRFNTKKRYGKKKTWENLTRVVAAQRYLLSIPPSLRAPQVLLWKENMWVFLEGKTSASRKPLWQKHLQKTSIWLPVKCKDFSLLPLTL